MLTFKPNILFSFIAYDQSTRNCIESCRSQNNVKPFIVANHVAQNNSFCESKSLCPDPFIYEPNNVLSSNMMIGLVNNEQFALGRSVQFGLNNNCQYFCFMTEPVLLHNSFVEEAIKQIKKDSNEVIGAYSNFLTNSGPGYTNLDRKLNFGSVVIMSEKVVRLFNHPTLNDFLSQLVNMGVFWHFDEFLYLR